MNSVHFQQESSNDNNNNNQNDNEEKKEDKIRHKKRKRRDIKANNLTYNYNHWKQKVKEIQNLFDTQCPGLIPNASEKSLYNVAAIGEQNDIPLITYYADTYNRYRIEEWSKNKKDIQPGDFLKQLPYYRSLHESNNPGKEVHAVLSSC